MELQKQIEIVKELLEAANELNGEHQEGWDETIINGNMLLNHLKRLSEDNCPCDWREKTRNLMIGLEAEHIEEFMHDATKQQYLEYGLAYMDKVKKLIKR